MNSQMRWKRLRNAAFFGLKLESCLDKPQDDPTQRQPDIMLAKKLLEFEPKVGPEDGLRESIRYFEKIVR